MILERFKNVFEGIDSKTNEAIEARLEIEPSAVPVTQKMTHVLYQLEKPLKQWLEEEVEKDIFEKVPSNEAVT